MSDDRLRDEDITTTWRQDLPDPRVSRADPDGTDGDATDGTDGDSADSADSDGQDS